MQLKYFYFRLAADKSAELVETLVREAEIKRKLEDTNYKIKDMSRKLENYAGFMKNLSEKVKRLQYENRVSDSVIFIEIASPERVFYNGTIRFEVLQIRNCHF